MPREYAARLPQWFQEGVQAMQSGNPIPASTQLGVPLHELPNWKPLDASYQPMEADRPVSEMHAFGRPDGGFFRFEGSKAPWDQPYVREMPDSNDPLGCVGVGVLFIDQHTGKVLVNFKKSPFGVELAPTVQASYTNLKNRSDKIPFVQLLRDPSEYKLIQEFNPDRVLGPVRIGVEVVDPAQIDLTGKEEQFAWFSTDEIAEMTVRDGIPGNAFFDGAFKLANALIGDSRLSHEQEQQLRNELAHEKAELQEARRRLQAIEEHEEGVAPTASVQENVSVQGVPLSPKKQPGLLGRFWNWFKKLFS